jgi:hypothetical protein
LKDRAKIASLRIFAAVIDFRLRPHRVSKPLRSDVSRQQRRSFNDLQGHRVANSATAFDNRRCIVLKEKIPLTKGRLPEACREVEWVRFPRADLQSAPGRPWEDARPALRPAYEKLVRLGQAETDNARFLAKSQEARPGTERWRSFAYARAAVERRQACALR